MDLDTMGKSQEHGLISQKGKSNEVHSNKPTENFQNFVKSNHRENIQNCTQISYRNTLQKFR